MQHPAELAGRLRVGDAAENPGGMKVPQAAGMGAQVTPSTLPGLGGPAHCKHLPQGPETVKPAVKSMLSLLLSSPSRSPASIQLQ